MANVKATRGRAAGRAGDAKAKPKPKPRAIATAPKGASPPGTMPPGTTPAETAKTSRPRGPGGQFCGAKAKAPLAVAARRGSKKTLAPVKAPKALDLVLRIYATIAGELTKLDQQDGMKSQDRERMSRALSQMANTLDKAIGMQERAIMAQKPKGRGAKDKEALAHAEDLRRDIAQRIERLRLQRTSSK